MEMSSSTTNSRTGAPCLSKTLHLRIGCRKQGLGNFLSQQLPHHCWCHVMSTRTGISFLTGNVNSDGGSILKSVRVAEIVPVIRIMSPCFSSLKGTCLYWAVCPANWISRSTLMLDAASSDSTKRGGTTTRGHLAPGASWHH